MKRLIILIGLLASTLLVEPSEAAWFGNKNAPDNSVDPVSRLSDVLTQLTQDETLAANIDAALEHNWHAEFQKANQPSFQRAVALFLELNGDDISDPINLVNAQELRELAGENNIEFHLHESQQRRVFGFIQKLENLLNDDGFVNYEDLWEADASRQERFQKQFAGLVHLGLILDSHAKAQQSKLNENFRELSGAMALFKEPGAIVGSRLNDIVAAMAEIHKMKRYKNGLKLNAKVGLTAEKLLNDYLVKPCEALIVQPEVETILEPIKNLALYVNFDEEPSKCVDAPKSWSLFWASRFIFCEALVKQTNLGELAAKLAKS